MLFSFLSSAFKAHSLSQVDRRFLNVMDEQHKLGLSYFDYIDPSVDPVLNYISVDVDSMSKNRAAYLAILQFFQFNIDWDLTIPLIPKRSPLYSSFMKGFGRYFKETFSLFEEIMLSHYHLMFSSVLSFQLINNLYGLTFDNSPATLPYPWQILFQSPVSPFMDKLDLLHGYIMGFLSFIVAFVLGWLFFLLLRFSYASFKGSTPKIVQIQHNSLLEFIWTVVPFAILLIIFSSSAALIYDGANKTNILDTIKVIGNQWYWNYGQLSGSASYDALGNNYPIIHESIAFSYINYDSYIIRGWLRICEIPGEEDPEECVFHPFYLLKSDNPLLLPAREWLRFLISSNDVIHSWALPVAGIKCDAVPGRINEVVSLLSLSGEYFGQCSELCGINHGFMPIHVWCYMDSNIL